MNANIRPATQNGNTVTIDSNSVMIFCNTKGAVHYMRERSEAKRNPAHEIVTRTFEAKPKKATVSLR